MADLEGAALVVRNALGRRIRELREQRGWSQRELARQTGRHQSSVSDWENGAADMSLATIVRLADALGLPLAEMFDDTEIGAATRSAPAG